MGEVVTIARETVAEFVRREGKGAGMSTMVIGFRFGWNSREAYVRLLDLERKGAVHRTGLDRVDVGAAQFWLPGPANPGTED